MLRREQQSITMCKLRYTSDAVYFKKNPKIQQQQQKIPQENQLENNS